MQTEWISTGAPTLGSFVAHDPAALLEHIAAVRSRVHIVRTPEGRITTALALDPRGATLETVGTLPPLYPEWLGDRSFLETHGVRFAYVAGAMATGIATTRLVIEMARANMLGFFGAGGLPPDRVEAALHELREALGGTGLAWGSNLIHSPHEPALEEAVADLYIRYGVNKASASAYMRLTPAVVRYAYHGIRVSPDGTIERPHHVFAKISRPEVAEQFMRPAPDKLLQQLVERQLLTADEARLASRLPVAEDITVEADSGGHTDNRPLGALFPTIVALRDRVVAETRPTVPIRVGAAGGLGTPTAVASAFAMGAAYVLTGSINQSAVEAGASVATKEMLAQAGVADVAMAPSPDMFELGVKVQVLKRGTLFQGRAQQLYDLYQTYQDWGAIPQPLRDKVEKTIFRTSYEKVWEETEKFWKQRAPREAQKGRDDPRHQMALCFRWYVGLASHWSIAGTPDRTLDYQVWCGPAMGAFNAWVAGSFLEPLANRTVVQIARNLLEGAAVVTRAHQLRSYGVDVPAEAFDYRPEPLD